MVESSVTESDATVVSAPALQLGGPLPLGYGKTA